ncbi:hypothetical protein Fmac_001352 [Flemingia macrophylla]|uniref:Uncharacterized protein n=1 Tax=Flemingia macrophylla TaxID=520843 RepID=A0ABD1NGU5_9FABA
MSGLDAVKYSSDPIIPRYVVLLIDGEFSSIVRAQDVCMGVFIGFVSSILYFFRSSFAYLV